MTENLEIEATAWESNLDSYVDYKIPPKKITAENLVLSFGKCRKKESTL